MAISQWPGQRCDSFRHGYPSLPHSSLILARTTECFITIAWLSLGVLRYDAVSAGSRMHPLIWAVW